ncbi:GIY-YIG catalytic domain protein [Burkholderia thailandensis 34]|nr:GIY-YIG catalytic domain protein [Burkholderia thailandensis 34]AOJ56101.1 excinuclease [Burkholderia thailandensis]KXF59891.1 excinuclease [Burkholderia thailandensis]PNE76055.1 GIY-YIG nuclease family protein [Burkholderia thailandensis]
MSWYLYLIECADGSVYTGITTDVAARFAQHAQGKGARYTRARKPKAVLASFELADRSSASRAEYRVKRLTPMQKRALADGSLALSSVLPATDDAAARLVDDDCAATATDDAAAARRAVKPPAKPKKAANAAKISGRTATGSS